MSDSKIQIKPAAGKLGVMMVGLGAVSTTFIAGVEIIKTGAKKPIGSQAWMGTARLGKRTDNRVVKIKDLVSIAAPEDIEIAAWDIFSDNAYEAALKAGVLSSEDLDLVKDKLRAITPLKGAFDRNFVKNLDGRHIKTGSRMEMVDGIRQDIADFKKKVNRVVIVWAASTEIHSEPSDIHQSTEAFEKALAADDKTISPSQLYAYAALKEGVPFANGAPNLSVDVPCMVNLAKKNGVPISGKDFKTGQTLLKTILAPGLQSRLLGISGWFSTNILGNRDGEVLDDPDSFRSKEVSKSGVLDTICDPEKFPELYKDLYHKIRINYYPPRGDAKEGWDNIDIFGWLNYPMQIKVNFLCRDSILAAPIVADLAIFMDLAQRAGFSGIQEWLSFFYKSPQTAPGLYAEHDLNIQKIKFKNTLRYMAGEELITHLGQEYYEDSDN